MHRSFHFIPGHKAALFGKLKTLPADHIIFDLEDGVPGAEKETARQATVSFLSTRPNHNYWVRINAEDTEHFNRDCELLRKLPNIGIVVPKVNGQSNLDAIAQKVPVHPKRLIALIESFESLEHLSSFANSPLLYAICLGLEDLFSTVAQPSNELGVLARHVRLKMLVTAKANGLICIDGISTNYTDLPLFQQECRDTRALGFDAKLTIHPAQLTVVNDAFGIPDQLASWAIKIKQKSNLKADFGYTMVDGELITPPKIEKAKAILKAMESPNE